MSPLIARTWFAQDGSLHLALAGAIDETCDLEAALASIDRDVVIDVSAVDRMNSVGVHRWITTLDPLSRRHAVTIEACPYPMVLQANVVANFFGAAKVASCLAPYFCTACQQTPMLQLSAEEVGEAGGGPPEKPCPSCGGALTFDELESYFAFLDSARGATRRPR
ncbi:MAG: anti-sigma factor antagonist [Deltaproteobacteria bacterium]|nr:anti-sigma factor antagonist [Deltaproteobacteria bacterium]